MKAGRGDKGASNCLWLQVVWSKGPNLPKILQHCPLGPRKEASAAGFFSRMPVGKGLEGPLSEAPEMDRPGGARREFSLFLSLPSILSVPPHQSLKPAHFFPSCCPHLGLGHQQLGLACAPASSSSPSSWEPEETFPLLNLTIPLFPAETPPPVLQPFPVPSLYSLAINPHLSLLYWELSPVQY